MRKLPTNKRLHMYADRAELFRDVAAYEHERIASLRRLPAGDRAGDGAGERSARFEASITDELSLGFIRVEGSSYVEGYSPELKQRILSIPNRANDLELWASMLDTPHPARVTVPYDYHLSETTITNRMFAAFVAETGYETLVSRHRTGWYVDGRAQWREGIACRFDLQPWPLSAPDHPVTQVSWFDAMSFAVWLGAKTGTILRVPTIEEYLLASIPIAFRSGACLFPWGNGFDGIEGRMNFATRELDGYDWIYDQYADGHAFTSPVTAYPPNELGLYDLLGNVWVWNYTSVAGFDSRLAGDRTATVPDAASLGVGENAVIAMRGGCYLARLTHANLHSRMGHPALEGACDIGFRLVAVAPEQAGL